MIKATRNQLSNTSNRYQTKTKRILAVCSASLLRSPTIANVLHREYGFNTRACGHNLEYALIPISEALVYWADEVVFADTESYNAVVAMNNITLKSKTCSILNIPDEYDWNDPELRLIIRENFMCRERFEHSPLCEGLTAM